jgi:hypothetical protein
MLHIMQQLQMETTSKDLWKQKGNPLKEAINTREERIARGSAGPSYPGNPPLNLRPRASIFPSHYYPCIQLDILRMKLYTIVVIYDLLNAKTVFQNSMSSSQDCCSIGTSNVDHQMYSPQPEKKKIFRYCSPFWWILHY